jgi:segregation and condensation protein A
MPYELKSEKFTGPLEKLLELIEARRMEITQVNLAQVTDDFLKYLKTLSGGEMDMRLVADFIAVASRLILIKSKYLLPDLTLTEEEEMGMKDLERRLKIYQELKPTLKILAKLWSGGQKEFSRTYFALGGLGTGEGGSGFFYPGKKLELGVLFGAMRDIFKDLENFQLETKIIKEKIVTIEEKMKEVMERMQKQAELSLSALSGDKSRIDIIITFLAILHLARERLILLEQNSAFSDIIIKKQ